MTDATHMGAGNKVLSLQDIIDAKQRDIDSMKQSLIKYKRESEAKTAQQTMENIASIHSASSASTSDNHVNTNGNNDDSDDNTDNTMEDVMSIVKWARNEEIRKREKEIDTAQSTLAFYKELLNKGTKTQSLENDIKKFEYFLNEKSQQLSEFKDTLSQYSQQLNEYTREIRTINVFLNESGDIESNLQNKLEMTKNRSKECEKNIEQIDKTIHSLTQEKQQQMSQIRELELSNTDHQQV